ncbi:MAG: penicillin acylase family protein [Planctomycetota bacterium]|nr:penicillin acylase family protein [Planctomycetota bacterium]
MYRFNRFIGRALCCFLGALVFTSYPSFIQAQQSRFAVPGGSNPSTKTVQLAGTSVQIDWDIYGVPHIQSATDKGAYFGAGYAHAEQRFFQMNVWKLMYQGRYAEYFGPGKQKQDGTLGTEYIDHDRKARLRGWRRHAEREVRNLDQETHSLLKAYVDGVNAYLQSPQRSLHPHFSRYQIPVRPWTLADSIGIWSRLGRTFSPSGLNEASNLHQVRYYRQQGLSNAQIRRKIKGDVKCDDYAAIVKQSDVPRDLQDRMFDFARRHNVNLDGSLPNGVAPHFSHAWAVSGQKTTTGRAVLVGDPRTKVSVPSLWFEWHMKGKTFDVRGVGVPGNPNILVGSTPFNAWSVTALGLDQSDLFLLKVDRDGHPNQYCLDGNWRPWSKDETELIKVRGLPDQTVRYRECLWGSVVTGTIAPPRSSLTTGGFEDEEYAMKALPTAFPELSTLRGFVKMYRSQNIQTFGAALGDWVYPSANVVVASTGGDIGYWANGALPIRQPRAFLAGAVAQDGSLSSNDWIGLLPHELRPWVVNPACGYVMSANHLPIGSWYPIPTSSRDGDGSRSRRLREMLEAKPVFTPSEVQNMHFDTVNPVARDVIRLGLYLRDVQGFRLSLEAQRALVYLKPWLRAGARMEDNTPYTALARFLLQSLRRTHGPDAPALVDRHGGGQGGMHNFLRMKIADIEASPARNLDGLTARHIDWRLQKAWILVQTRVGSGPAAWRNWMHAELLQPLDLWGGLENFDPLESGVIFHDALTATFSETVLSQMGQSYTQVVEVGLRDGAVSVLPVGQSEDSNSKHFLSQRGLWTNGGFKSSPTSRRGIQRLGIERRIYLRMP